MEGRHLSSPDWPKVNVEGDERKYPSFWGDERSNLKGGCCSGSLTEYLTGNHWGQPFSMSYGVTSFSVAYMEQQIAAAVAAAVATEKAAASTTAIAVAQEQQVVVAAKDTIIAEKESAIAEKESTITANVVVITTNEAVSYTHMRDHERGRKRGCRRRRGKKRW